MNGNLVDTLLQLFHGLPDWLIVSLLTIIPVVEMQAAIPVAIGVFRMPWWQIYPIVALSNMIPAIVVLFGWSNVISWAQKHFPALHGFMSRYHDALHTRWQDKIDRYGPLALFLFVAIPGPFSGVWSGSLIAWIFGIHRKPAFIAIFCGVLVAAGLLLLIPFSFFHFFPQGL